VEKATDGVSVSGQAFAKKAPKAQNKNNHEIDYSCFGTSGAVWAGKNVPVGF
jgi:hypothetical protein